MKMARIAFLFPGQGAQFVGMGKSLCEALPVARQLFTDASTILGYDLLDVCVNGPAERLDATVISQPALFVASLAALEGLKSASPEVTREVTATAGLSLGEYSALVFAGALDFADGLRVVQQRGRAMQAASDASAGGMVSILGLGQPEVEEVVRQAKADGLLEIANLLCPGNIVVSGSKAACDTVERLVGESRAKTVRLAVAGAFHTTLMKPADTALANALASVSLRPPKVPVWSNVDGKPHTDPEEIRGLLVRQVVEPVLWEQSVRGLFEAGCDRFFEIGPGRVLTGLLKRVQRKADITNIPA
jgi:[acyl-carrier-protein] S-malonyltransferase